MCKVSFVGTQPNKVHQMSSTLVSVLGHLMKMPNMNSGASTVRHQAIRYPVAWCPVSQQSQSWPSWTDPRKQLTGQAKQNEGRTAQSKNSLDLITTLAGSRYFFHSTTLSRTGPGLISSQFIAYSTHAPRFSITILVHNTFVPTTKRFPSEEIEMPLPQPAKARPMTVPPTGSRILTFRRSTVLTKTSLRTL